MTLTKEQLIEQASHNLRIMNSQSGEQQSNEAFMADLQLMEIAMASLTAEPMAYMHRSGQVVTRDECSDEEVFALCCKVDTPLYTAPQPLTTSERAELENYRNAQQVVPEAYVTAEHRRVIGMLLGVCGAAFELADDSCQQDVDGEECHVVPADSFKKLSDALGEIENTLPDEYQDLPDTVLQWAAVPRHALQAMLQGKAEPAKTGLTLREGLAAIRISGIAIDAEKILAERDALNEPTCWCRTCRPVTVTDMRFVVCPQCGNKRCPHANDCRNACTGSNEPAQEGSAYPAAPQQEVKP